MDETRINPRSQNRDLGHMELLCAMSLFLVGVETSTGFAAQPAGIDHADE
jgi:hypothetical protein